MTDDAFFAHPSADVAEDAVLGSGTQVWHQAQIREGARLGQRCNVGKGVYIDHDVEIGNAVKIQNRASIYHGTTIEDGVFVGPHVVFTNDLYPRAINPDGSPKTEDDWIVGRIVIRRGASIGAGSVILPDVEVGTFALVGAGSIVTRSVPAFGIVVGNPAKCVGYACKCGRKLPGYVGRIVCNACGAEYIMGDDGSDISLLAPKESSR